MNFPGVLPGTRAMTSSGALLCLLLVAACNLDNPGVDPPAGVLSFPIALAYRDPSAAEHDALYVANSNFDLRYNAGSVQVYDLAKLAKAINRADCRNAGLSGQDSELLYLDGSVADGGDAQGDAAVADAGPVPDSGPLSDDVDLPPGYEEGAKDSDIAGILCDGRDRFGKECCFERSDDYLLGGKGKSEILIDSFASAIAVAPDGKRLYVPVRSRDRLLYFDIDSGGQISCGDYDGRCKRGTTPNDKDKEPLAKLAPQVTALSVGRLSDMVDGNPKATFLATAHENGRVGFFVDTGKGPVLHSHEYANAARLTSITADLANRAFYVTTAFPRVSLISRFGLRKLDDRYALTTGSALSIGQVAGAQDTRDILIDAEDPNRLFALMRGTQSILFLRLDSTQISGVKLEGQVRVGNAPSRLTQATVDGRRVLFVSCFDARLIYAIDLETRELKRVIHDLAGPFEMLADEARGFLYVADFNVSVVRVVDIRGVFDRQLPPPRIIATLGKVRFAEDGLQ